MISSVSLREEREQFQLNRVPPPLAVRRLSAGCGSLESQVVIDEYDVTEEYGIVICFFIFLCFLCVVVTSFIVFFLFCGECIVKLSLP